MSNHHKERLLKEASDLFLRYRQDPRDRDAIQARDTFIARGDAERRAWAQIEDAWTVTGGKRKPKPRTLPVIIAVGFLVLGYVMSDPLRIYVQADHIADDTPLEVTLSSGDVAVLDATTALIDDSAGDVRRVKLLRGAGYFEVDQVGIPFVVTLDDVSVEVLGTAFEVARIDEAVQVAVFEGRVAVEKAGQRIEVLPGERLVWDDGEPELDRVDVSDVASWRRGRLVADGMTFGQVADVLDRRIPGQIVITNRRLRNVPMTGTLDVNRPMVSLRNLASGLGASVISSGPLGTVVYGGR